MKLVVGFTSVGLIFLATGLMASSALTHPSFLESTNFLRCEGIKFAGKPKPTIYFYAIDDVSMSAYRLDSDRMVWSDPYAMEKTPAQIIVKQSYGAWRIDRETLNTFHQSSVSSACRLVSLKQIDQYAKEVESRAKI
jgi:hypothetical protein